MSFNAAVELPWGDGEYRFRLGIDQLAELQEKVNEWRARIGVKAVGPRTLMEQLSGSDAWASDVFEVLRLGLIGGATPGDGMTPPKARVLVQRYGPGARPLAESSMTAYAILAAAFVGVPEDQPGKKGRRRREKAKTTASSSPSSTETGPQ